MSKTPWQKWKEANGEARPWDLINTNTKYVDEDIANQRYNICKSCPEFINLTKQCKKCGCFMSVKTKLENSKCPIGKW
jgi:hypothetical protein